MMPSVRSFVRVSCGVGNIWCTQIQKELGKDNVPVFAAGVGEKRLQRLPRLADPYLTLDGIRLVAERGNGASVLDDTKGMIKHESTVTGGAGFLSSHLYGLKRLLADGHEVICLDNFSQAIMGISNTCAIILISELIRHDVTEPHSFGSRSHL